MIKAVKALKEYSKKAKSDSLTKKLLEEEDDFIQVSFTLNEVPLHPSPKPL